MSQVLDTATLVAAARLGDRAAIEALLARSQPDIRRFARRACSVDRVEDAVQDTLLLVYRRIHLLRAVGAYSSWLFRIVRRECTRMARRAWPDGFGDDSGLDTVIATTPDDALRIDLASAIQSLPGHYRTVILMRDLEEMTIDEIAATCATTREAVKARLRRGRTLLREYLER